MTNILQNFPDKMLTPDEEDVCATTIRRYESGLRRGDAIDLLVSHTIRVAFYYVSKMSRNHLTESEIISLCYQALSTAARNFQPKRSRFFAFAKPHIRGALARFWKERSVVYGSMEERSLDASAYCGEISFGPLSSGDEADCPREASSDPDWKKIFANERLQQIAPALKKLTKREKKVLRLKYEKGFTFAEIGKVFGSTRKAAWGTHERALKKIRVFLFQKRQLFCDK